MSDTISNNDREEDRKSTSSNTSSSSSASTTFQPHSSLIQISEILQHSIEFKLCSSISTHNAFWDTLLHGIQNNPDVISLLISLLLTKYIQLANNTTHKRNTPLLQLLMSLLTINNLQYLQSSRDIISSEMNSKRDGSRDNSTGGRDNSNSGGDSRDNSRDGNGKNRDNSRDSNNEDTPIDNDSNDEEDGGDSGVSQPLMSLESIEEQIAMVQQQLSTGPTIPISSTNPEDIKDVESMKMAITNTITFIALFNTFNSLHPTLRVIIKQFTEIKEAGIGKIIKILSPGFKDSNEYILYLIDQCSDVDSNINYLILSRGLLQNSGNNIQLQQQQQQQLQLYQQILLQNSWANICLSMELKQSPNRVKMILDNLFLFLKHPLLTEKRMLFVLQMLKHMLLAAPIIPPTYLTQAMNLVKTYYLWPRPYCDFAKEVLELLTWEYRCPGAYYRSILGVEFPSIYTSQGTIGSSGTNTTNPPGSLTTNIKNNRPTIHMMNDRYISESLSIQELFESNYKSNIPSITQLQVNNIANIYQRVMGIDNSFLGLEFVNPNDISIIHYKLIDLMNKTIYMDEEESKSIRIKELGNLREEIIKVATCKTPQKHIPKDITLPFLNYHFTSLYRYTIKNKKPDEFATQYQFPVYKKTSNTLITILSNYQDQQDTDVVKICLIGNDSSIHHFIGSFVYLKYNSPELFEDLDFQFYLIPAGNQCRLTDFISTFDSWYNRQVSCIINSLYEIIPTFRPTNNYDGDTDKSFFNSMVNIKEDKKSSSLDQQQTDQQQSSSSASSSNEPLINTPSSFVLREVENVFREASFKLNIPLLKCEAWLDEANYHSIPFFTKAEIGLNPFVLGTGDSTMLENPPALKMSKYLPSNITIRFTQINPKGQITQQLVLDHKPYYELVIQNQIPKSIDQPVSPNSNSNNNNNNNNNGSGGKTRPEKMELSLIEWDTKKKRMKSDQSTLFTTNMVEIETNSKDDKRRPFDILLDGQLYGPYTKVRISYCTISNHNNNNNNNNDEICNLPIMTFLPYV